MKIWELKESDIIDVQREAILRAASNLGITDPEFRDNIELLNLIQDRDSNLFSLLESFYTAYWNYYYFIKVLAPYGKRNGMSTSEKEELSTYTKEKEEAKKNLVERLKSTKMQKV